MLDLTPTYEQPAHLLGEIGSNANRRIESMRIESGTVRIATGLVRGTDTAQCKAPSAITDLFLGIAIAYKEHGTFAPNSEYVYQAGDDICWIRQGDIIVAPIVAVDAGDAMFMETAGANAGKFTNTASGTTIPVNGTFEQTTINAGELCRIYLHY